MLPPPILWAACSSMFSASPSVCACVNAYVRVYVGARVEASPTGLPPTSNYFRFFGGLSLSACVIMRIM